MDLGSHFKELQKTKKKGINQALDVLVFIKVCMKPSMRLDQEEEPSGKTTDSQGRDA